MTGSATQDDKKPHPILGILAVLLGASLANLLGRLISVGGPDIRGALHLDFDSASWIGTSYNMMLMFIGPFSVYLGGLFGARRVLLGSGVVFTIVCLLMPFAGKLWILLALLGVAGLSGGTFYPLTLSFILRSLPMRYVHYGIAVYAFDIVVTTHVAHAYEGWLISDLSWHWIFWTIALLTPFMVLLVYYGIPRQPLPQPKPGQPKPSWRGFLYASVGAALLYAALDQGERLDWWRSGTFVALFCTGVFLVLTAVVRHFMQPNPLIDFPFLRRRNTLLLGGVLIIFRFVLLSAVVLIPSYLSAIQGYRPEQTGAVLLWVAIPQVFAGFVAIYLLGRIDERLIMSAGFALIAVACLLDSRISSVWSGNSFDGSQLILALGEGLAFNGLVGAIILDVLNSGGMTNPAAVLSFGGFFQTVRLLGGELGTSFTQFFLHHRQVFHFDQLATYLQGGSPSFLQREQILLAGMQAGSATRDVASGRAALLLGGQVKQQAFTLSIMDAFVFIAYAATASLFLIVFLNNAKQGFPEIVAASPTPKPSQQEQK